MPLLPMLELVVKIFVDNYLKVFLCREPWIDFNKTILMVKTTRPFPA